ncbi:MOSC domain-containing protein [soil metagenome]
MDEDAGMRPSVVAVHRDRDHRFSKPRVDVVTLVAGFGVAGDAHAGKRVQHRSRVAVDPSEPNLRQVHLMHDELFDELRDQGFAVDPGQFGENITTAGVDLLALPRGTRLRIGSTAVIQVTGLRNPCSQIEAFMPGLLKAVVHRSGDGSLVRKTGIMGVVEADGDVSAGDLISVELPAHPHEPLDRV